MNYRTYQDNDKLTRGEKAWAVVMLLMILAIIVMGIFIVQMFMADIGAKYVINKQSTNSYVKQGDCVLFTDTRGRDNKICGAYTIRERNFQK